MLARYAVRSGIQLMRPTVMNCVMKSLPVVSIPAFPQPMSKRNIMILVDNSRPTLDRTEEEAEEEADAEYMQFVYDADNMGCNSFPSYRRVRKN